MYKERKEEDKPTRNKEITYKTPTAVTCEYAHKFKTMTTLFYISKYKKETENIT